ncbi:hypothetical protein [Saccharicrinis sp. GN24d3]|uniref:hypothetical protein n=1 Tax=Saccharicrinis sp. GN24d3 TaxID=3458416 RepID=UPI00403564A4
MSLKLADISIAKFDRGTREVGGAHCTIDCSDNKTLHREGALLRDVNIELILSVLALSYLAEIIK